MENKFVRPGIRIKCRANGKSEIFIKESSYNY